MKTGICDREITDPSAESYRVMLSSDGSFAITSGKTKSIRIWNLMTGVCQSVFNYQSSFISPVYPFIRANQLYVLTGKEDGSFHLQSAHTFTETKVAAESIILTRNTAPPQPPPKTVTIKKTIPDDVASQLSARSLHSQFESKAARDSDEVAKLKERIRQLEQTASKSSPSPSPASLPSSIPIRNAKEAADIQIKASFKIDYTTYIEISKV